MKTLGGQSQTTQDHNARFAHLTNDEAWREYLGDDYENEEALQERGDAAMRTRYTRAGNPYQTR